MTFPLTDDDRLMNLKMMIQSCRLIEFILFSFIHQYYFDQELIHAKTCYLCVI